MPSIAPLTSASASSTPSSSSSTSVPGPFSSVLESAQATLQESPSSSLSEGDLTPIALPTEDTASRDSIDLLLPQDPTLLYNPYLIQTYVFADTPKNQSAPSLAAAQDPTTTSSAVSTVNLSSFISDPSTSLSSTIPSSDFTESPSPKFDNAVQSLLSSNTSDTVTSTEPRKPNPSLSSGFSSSLPAVTVLNHPLSINPDVSSAPAPPPRISWHFL